MDFVKKLSIFLVFTLGWGGVLAFVSFYFEQFGWVGSTPFWLLGIGFFLGILMGSVLARLFLKKKNSWKYTIMLLGTAGFTFLMTGIGFVLGANLGANGTFNVMWGGLVGYESAGILLGLFGSAVGAYVSYRVLQDKGLSDFHTLLMSLVGLALGLMVSYHDIAFLGVLIFAFPLLFIILLDGLKIRAWLQRFQRGGR